MSETVVAAALVAGENAAENAPAIIAAVEDGVAKVEDATKNHANIASDSISTVEDIDKITGLIAPHLSPVATKVDEILAFLANLFPGHAVPSTLKK